MTIRLFVPALALLLLAAPARSEEPAAAEQPACTYPVKLLWHQDTERGTHRMGVSVLNTNGQQVPGLKAEHFTVTHKGTEVPHTEAFRVTQSKAAFVQIAGEGEEAGPTGADPINYDVYFTVDLTSSMGDEIDVGGKKGSKHSWAVKIVNALVRPNKKGSSLFDEQDRVYISGFTSHLQNAFMTSATAQRDRITEGLVKLNEFAPTDGEAALYEALLNTLRVVEASASQYSDPANRRQAVVIVITDSFNGMDPERQRKLRYCADNNAWNDQVRDALIRTREAVAENLKVYVLAMGQETDTKYYSLTEDSDRWRCRIGKTERETLDGRSFRAITDVVTGGYYPSPDPRRLAHWLTAQFEALKNAYQVEYPIPETSPNPSTMSVTVTLGDDSCTDTLVERRSFVPHAVATEATTSSGEVAMLLASLILILFFLPRSLMNVATLADRPAPARRKPKRKRGKGKKKHKRR